MKIEVTQENIHYGIPGNPTCCPVANALYQLGLRVKVHSDGLLNWNEEVIVALPEEVVDRIMRYDLTEDMTPFTFEIPDEHWEVLKANSSRG